MFIVRRIVVKRAWKMNGNLCTRIASAHEKPWKSIFFAIICSYLYVSNEKVYDVPHPVPIVIKLILNIIGLLLMRSGGG